MNQAAEERARKAEELLAAAPAPVAAPVGIGASDLSDAVAGMEARMGAAMMDAERKMREAQERAEVSTTALSFLWSREVFRGGAEVQLIECVIYYRRRLRKEAWPGKLSSSASNRRPMSACAG